MSVISIWARDFYDNTIAIDGKIPWHIPSDLKRFSHITQGSVVVVGRKTYETLPHRDLPGRIVVVLTKDSSYQVAHPDRHLVVTSIDRLKEARLDLELGDIFVAGGASVYQQFFEHDLFKPDYVVDCRIRDTQLHKKLEVYPKERRTLLNPYTDKILKEEYVVIKSSSTKDKFVNTLYFRKDASMTRLMEGIAKNF